jgi:hypothetical protein
MQSWPRISRQFLLNSKMPKKLLRIGKNSTFHLLLKRSFLQGTIQTLDVVFNSVECCSNLQNTLLTLVFSLCVLQELVAF